MSAPRQPLVPETGLKVREPPDHAGGPEAAVSLGTYCLQHMGLLRSGRTLLRLNQDGGFDCPGCAWPDPERGSPLEFCENGARAVADEATRFRADPAFWGGHTVTDLLQWSDRDLNRAGRITHPMILREGATHYVPVAWNEAFERIAAALERLDSPDEAAFYTSGRTSNEAAFLYQLFARRLGTNNLPDCSNMCHESSGTGMGEVVGVGKGTVLLEDFEHADVILVIGQNPGTNHPRMLTTLQEARRRGAHLVAINPLREVSLERFKHPKELGGWVGPGTELADLFLQVKVGGDVALLTGLVKGLLERDAVDHAFVQTHTTGFEALAAHVAAIPWDAVVARSGVPRSALDRAVELLAGTQRIIACWAMGLTQHVHGVANVQMVVDLLLLRGALGRQGAGLCPVRGHSNVQGDRTMGIWEKPPKEFLDALGEAFDFEPPRAHGFDVVDTIRAMRDGRVRVFFAMGGNFLSATPDTDVTADALRRCDLTVHVSTKPNRSHLVHGREALILPCLGRTERHVTRHGRQVVTVENSMGVVHTSEGAEAPASPHLLSEPEIVARLALATFGAHDRVDWLGLATDLDRTRDAIATVVPGFEDFNRRVRRPRGFVLPNPVRDGPTFPVPGGRARFTTHDLPDLDLRDDELVLMTLRSHDQYNTTIYGLDDRYRGISGGRRVVFLNAEDLAARGLLDGQVVGLRSRVGDQEREAPGWRIVAYEIPRGCAAAYFPEANVLVPLDHTARKSNTPASKSVPIRIVA